MEVAGVLDITTTELADELVGGVMSVGPHRWKPPLARVFPRWCVPGRSIWSTSVRSIRFPKNTGSGDSTFITPT